MTYNQYHHGKMCIIQMGAGLEINQGDMPYRLLLNSFVVSHDCIRVNCFSIGDNIMIRNVETSFTNCVMSLYSSRTSRMTLRLKDKE